jgi:hypothetical protein
MHAITNLICIISTRNVQIDTSLCKRKHLLLRKHRISKSKCINNIGTYVMEQEVSLKKILG